MSFTATTDVKTVKRKQAVQQKHTKHVYSQMQEFYWKQNLQKQAYFVTLFKTGLNVSSNEQIYSVT